MWLILTSVLLACRAPEVLGSLVGIDSSHAAARISDGWVGIDPSGRIRWRAEHVAEPGEYGANGRLFLRVGDRLLEIDASSGEVTRDVGFLAAGIGGWRVVADAEHAWLVERGWDTTLVTSVDDGTALELPQWGNLEFTWVEHGVVHVPVWEGEFTVRDGSLSDPNQNGECRWHEDVAEDSANRLGLTGCRTLPDGSRLVFDSGLATVRFRVRSADGLVVGTQIEGATMLSPVGPYAQSGGVALALVYMRPSAVIVRVDIREAVIEAWRADHRMLRHVRTGGRDYLVLGDTIARWDADAGRIATAVRLPGYAIEPRNVLPDAIWAWRYASAPVVLDPVTLQPMHGGEVIDVTDTLDWMAGEPDYRVVGRVDRETAR